MGKRIYLHAGAHRTGSSSFQMCLYENRELLRNAGYDLAYPGRDGVPEGRLKLRLPSPRHHGAKVRRYIGAVRDGLANLSPDPTRKLIMSEENVPGAMLHFFKGQFFPAAERRFRCLRKGSGDARFHILYVLRAYDEFYVSAWRKRAEDREVPDFETLVPKYLGMDRGWPELIGKMRDILRPDSLTVLRYRDRGSSRELLTRLLPDVAVEDLSEPSVPMNLSATDAAILVLQDRFRRGETLARNEWQEIVRSYADKDTPLGLATFSPTDREVLRQRYEEDLKRVGRMDGVTLI